MPSLLHETIYITIYIQQKFRNIGTGIFDTDKSYQMPSLKHGTLYFIFAYMRIVEQKFRNIYTHIFTYIRAYIYIYVSTFFLYKSYIYIYIHIPLYSIIFPDHLLCNLFAGFF